jgi:hypothetical protein
MVSVYKLSPRKTFYFVSIDQHFQQGHFHSWRELCKSALELENSLFLQYESFQLMVEDVISNHKVYCGQHLHLEWIHDLTQNQILEFDNLANKYDFNWSSHMAISQAVRNNNGSSKKTVKALFKCLMTMSRLTAVWSWDSEFDRKSYGNFRIFGVPDIQSLVVKPMKCLLCVQAEKSGRFIKFVGLVGQLYGYRGVDHITTLARKYKDTEFLLWGKKFANTYKPKTIDFLNSKPKNLVLIDEYFETDYQLNHAINHLSCLIIDTSRYPEPSGIAVRALAFGIPVLINEDDSYLKYLSKHNHGIHVNEKNFFRHKEINWEKVAQPIKPISGSRESDLIKLRNVAHLTCEDMS